MMKRILGAFAIFMIIFSCLTITASDLVFADDKSSEQEYSSMHNTKGAIYAGIKKEKEKKDPNDDNKDDKKDDETDKPNEKKEDVSWAEETFADLVRSLGTGLEKLLNNDDISLDTIIYGRVWTGANTINWFTFELEKGNPYGVTGAIMFEILKRISMSFIVVAGFSMFIPIAWGGGKEKSLAKLKENLGRFLLAFIMLFAAPYVVALFISLRDIVLFLVHKSTTSEAVLSSLKGSGIADAYYKASKSSKTLLDAALYLSVVVISVWLAMVYVFTAIGAMINFIFFPIVCLFSYKDSSLIKNWVKTMAADIATPVIDSILFIVPLIMSGFGAPNVVVFATSMAVIPSRSIVRNTLGIAQGSRMGDILGMGAVMAAGKMIGGTMRTMGNIKQSASDIKNDFAMGKMYDGMSKDVGTLNSLKAKSMGQGGIASSGGLATLSSTQGESGTPSRMDQQEMVRSKNALESGSGDAESKYLASQANVNNFESPMVRGSLSNQDMAKFYRQRARRAAGKLTASVAGNVVGGGIGLSATMFGSPATKMMATSAGSMIGGEVAPIAASAAVKSIKEGSEFFKDSTGYIQEKSNAIGQATRNFVGDYRGTTVADATGLDDLDSIEPEIFDNASKFNESDDVREQIAGINVSTRTDENKVASIKNVRSSAFVGSVNRQLAKQGKPPLSDLASKAVYAGAYEMMGDNGREALDGALVKANISSVATTMKDAISYTKSSSPQDMDVESSQEAINVDVPVSSPGDVQTTVSESASAEIPAPPAGPATDISVSIDETNATSATSTVNTQAPLVSAATFFRTRKETFSKGIPQDVLLSIQNTMQEKITEGLQVDTPEYTQKVAEVIACSEASWLSTDVRSKNPDIKDAQVIKASQTYINQRKTELNKKFENAKNFDKTLSTYGLSKES